MRSPFRGRRSGGRSAALFSLLLLGVLAAACGGSSAAAPQSAPRNAGDGALPAASMGGGQQPADDSGAGSPSGGSGSGSGGNSGDQFAALDDTKIVRTGTLQMTVDDVAKALTGGRDAIRNLGGYIGASQQERSEDRVVASVTYRIPVARWEDALDALRRLGTEVAEKTDAAEVTGQIVDLGARIRNLKASEAALVGYAQTAPKVSDLLEIQSRLTDTRSQIERLTAQEAGLQDQAAMATLTVTFGTDVVAVTETAQRWDPGAEVDRASATLIGMGQALVSVGIVFLIVWVPLLLAISIVAGLTLFVLRRLGFTRPNRLPPIPPLAPPPTSAES